MTHVKNLDFAVCASACPHHFGFLGKRPKNSAIPDECLTCEKIIDCMAFASEDAAAEPELSAVEDTEDLAEEFGKEDTRERLEEVKVEHDEADRSTERVSNDDFTVEDPGVLYAHWSGTVLIRKETLHNWGKVKEVDIETEKGKILACKVYPVEDLETGVIQVPDRMQLRLGVKEGSIVKVKPAFKP